MIDELLSDLLRPFNETLNTLLIQIEDMQRDNAYRPTGPVISSTATVLPLEEPLAIEGPKGELSE